jgi:hypothetical protein
MMSYAEKNEGREEKYRMLFLYIELELDSAGDGGGHSQLGVVSTKFILSLELI